MSQDALVDLSGAIGETVKLNDKQLNKELLWERMLLSNDLEYGPLLCAGISVSPRFFASFMVLERNGMFTFLCSSVRLFIWLLVPFPSDFT